MLIVVIQILGWLLAVLPQSLLRGISWVLGNLLYLFGGRRRHVALGSLYHAYPERSAKWRAGILKESCCQLIEMALFVAASPHMGERRLRAAFRLSDTLRENWQREATARDGQPAAVVALVPHTSLFEALTLLPMLNDAPLPVGTLYRPLNQPAVERWVLRTRQRFGMRMLSRKKGLTTANRFLAKGGAVAVLFDQNAGTPGLLTTLYGRLCSTTELPGILAARNEANVCIVWANRTGFWQAQIECHPLGRAPQSPSELCFRSNAWLEDTLRNDASLCAQWLWLHDRWRTQDAPAQRFSINHRRNALEEEMRWRGLDALPRGTHYWVRLPNWLGDVIMALPLLRAMRRGRPDGYFTLLAAPHFIPLLEALDVADRCLPLPKKGEKGYWKTFWQWRGQYPHVQVLFTNSQRGDIEARLIGAPQRFGIVRHGKPRPLLTDAWRLPADLDEAALHQTHLWQRFLNHFGLKEAPDYSPLGIGQKAEPFPFAADGSQVADGSVAIGTAGNAGGGAANGAGDIAASSTASTTCTEGETSTACAGTAAALRGRTVGFVCGTENTPEKRWPIERWRELLAVLTAQGVRCVLFGTRNDAAITAQVAQGCMPQQVLDRAGKTDLLNYAAELQACDLLITNDTGGMHLANALGVPVVVIFGPTNPVRTGPIFDAPAVCLQPPGCPPQGGAPITGVTTAAVMEAAEALLAGDVHPHVPVQD